MADERNYYLNQAENGADYSMQYCLDFYNKRLRVDDYTGNTQAICKRSQDIALEHALTKVFIKSRAEDWLEFLSRGWMLEGVYKGYFLGGDAYCMAYYLELARRSSECWMEEDQILRQVQVLPVKPEQPAVPEGLTLRIAGVQDAEALAVLYSAVFRTYPTPMFESDYVEKVLLEGTVFYVMEASGELISAASAEINTVYGNAEMTDCATLPAYRNRGLMRVLLHALEEELRQRQIRCAYSLARARSHGMNAVFHQMGYEYCGRLTKNCDIYETFEDMNLWVKRL